MTDRDIRFALHLVALGYARTEIVKALGIREPDMAACQAIAVKQPWEMRA